MVAWLPERERGAVRCIGKDGSVGFVDSCKERGCGTAHFRCQIALQWRALQWRAVDEQRERAGFAALEADNRFDAFAAQGIFNRLIDVLEGIEGDELLERKAA